MDCLQSANIGVYLSHDESLNVKEENKVKCVAWERHIYNWIIIYYIIIMKKYDEIVYWCKIQL